MADMRPLLLMKRAAGTLHARVQLPVKWLCIQNSKGGGWGWGWGPTDQADESSCTALWVGYKDRGMLEGFEMH